MRIVRTFRQASPPSWPTKMCKCVFLDSSTTAMAVAPLEIPIPSAPFPPLAPLAMMLKKHGQMRLNEIVTIQMTVNSLRDDEKIVIVIN